MVWGDSQGQAPMTRQAKVLIAFAIIFVAVTAFEAWALFALLTEPQPSPPNGKVFIGRLDAELTATALQGNLTGPASFAVAATPVVNCYLAINNGTAYKSECKSFTRVYEFEESVEFSIEIQLPVNVSEAFFGVTIAAFSGAGVVQSGRGVFSEQPTTVSLPPARVRALDSSTSPIKDYANRTLSQSNPFVSLVGRGREFAAITVNGSASLEITLTITVTTLVVVTGDECRGVTEIRVYQDVSADLEFQLRLELEEPEKFPDGTPFEIQISGPDSDWV